MKFRRVRLIHIHRCRGITRRLIKHFLHDDPTLEKLYSLSASSLSQLFSIPMKNAKLFYSDLHNKALKSKLKTDLKTTPIITIVDENYPNVLKQIKDPPLVLYALGDLSLLHYKPSLSVIGTRNPSLEAKEKINFFLRPLIEKGFLIVSGMAQGIDSFAHQEALNHNGLTIAVLGSGLNYIYPRHNKQLFNEISRKGLIVSEYPPDTPPQRYHFPERNRIISGLSFGTLVIEAMERSGTMITVDQALDQGREVYAVPGSPLLPQTKGCNQMIQDGAKLVLSSEDIFEDWDNVGRNLFYSI